MEEVLEVSIEPEIKEVLDNHKVILEDHGKSITKLQIDNASIKEQLNSIKTQMTDVKEIITDLKSSYLQSTNSMMGTLSAVLQNTSNNNTEIIKTNSNNKKEIAIKVLAVIGGLITGYFALKGVGIKII
ncbi:hypothetical protein [Desulfosporosinus sp.]|uniref:hypothetical protein n=1 Tax=Desulfosporosinus sp. TaxID=157907 RepID=UPI002621A69B|nr:hypothetical protein [Desulfosporosinus sp.]